jgi:diguanylate cyclase (GGDEF)-like protein
MATSRLSRAPGAVGLVFVDLDAFKAVNDRYGHAIGDHVLVEVARRLRAVVRDEDTVARFGGDEFVILVQSDAADDALEALAARVRQVVSEPIRHASSRIQIGVSTGWTTTVRPDEAPEAVLARADAAMYAAKRSLPPGVTG